MTLLSELWSIGSFRRSVRALPRVAEQHKELLVAALADGADPELLVEGAGLENQKDMRLQLASSLAALQALRHIRDQEGLEDLLSNLAELEPDSQTYAPLLRELLYEDESQAESRRLRLVEGSALPILMNMTVEVDFRVGVGADWKGLQPPKLVPIMIVRLEFDEHIGGSDAVVFQVSHARAGQLAKVLDDANELRDKIVQELPVSLLPKSLAKDRIPET